MNESRLVNRINPAWLMVGASFLFATMGVCVKLASSDYSTGEIVFYRGLMGTAMVFAAVRWTRSEERRVGKEC